MTAFIKWQNEDKKNKQYENGRIIDLQLLEVESFMKEKHMYFEISSNTC